MARELTATARRVELDITPGGERFGLTAALERLQEARSQDQGMER